MLRFPATDRSADQDAPLSRWVWLALIVGVALGALLQHAG